MKNIMLRLISTCLVFAILCPAMAEEMGDDGFDRDWICPVCGTLLNTQDGFSADLDMWTCKVCNSILGSDGDVTMGFDPVEGFKNARFPGVYWYCDNCEAFLNIQNGFDDHYDNWVCEECGHVNPISDSEIYDSEEDYRRSLGISYASDGQHYFVTPRIYEGEEKFDFMCIINTDKFDSFGNTPELYELAKSNKKQYFCKKICDI